MNSLQMTREMLRYSTLDQADRHMHSASTLAASMLTLPPPLIGGAVWGFFFFQPEWYTDPFLWAILILFVFGQLGALVQSINLALGMRKARRTLLVLRNGGERPDLETLQGDLMNKTPAGHTRDNVLRWIQLGLQGETAGIERMMEHSAGRREQAAAKVLSFHTLINRITLKMGFLGTLIGLLMTFEPMKQAMLALQGSEGEFRFITDICKAIDGDAYAILTTLFATGLSVFIELLTLQLFERILGQFEMVNNNLDDWCLIHLMPWIKENYSSRKNSDALVEYQRQFSEKIAAMQKTMDEQIATLTQAMQNTGRQILAIAPLQQRIGETVKQLTEYEQHYRQFLHAKLQGLAPPPPPSGAASSSGSNHG